MPEGVVNLREVEDVSWADVIVHVDSLKDTLSQCPRCWHYDGIPENYLGVCDRCQMQIRLGVPDYIRLGKMTEEQGTALLEEIRQACKRQIEKYWKGGRAAEGSGFENRRSLRGPESSNLSPSSSL